MVENAPAIGIDFGTANSSTAWYDPRTGTAEVILNAEGQVKTPSLVHFGAEETLVGEPVDNLLRDVSTDRSRRDEVFRRTIVSIKRNLLSPPRIALPGGRYVRPIDVMAEILKKLKRDAEDGHFHEKIGRAVITCPAEFNVLQRQKIEEAGRLAGFLEVVLVEEPVAGALAYAQEGLDVGKHVLVYDLGGGTFDLAVLDNEGESFHVAMEPRGMERCGGDDFDLALYHHCDEVARENLGRPISLTGTVDLSFLRVCRRAKESLTFQNRGWISDYLTSENGPVRFEAEVDRTTFEDLIGEYIETTTRLTKEILQQANTRGHEVTTVVLVGGSTRVPMVVRTLEDTLPVSPLGFDKKDVAVALGAAHYTRVRWPSEPASNGKGPVLRSGSTPAPSSEDGATGLLENANVARYRAAVVETYADGKFTRVEANRLEAFGEQLGLNERQVLEVEREVMGNAKEGVLFGRYRQAVETVWADGELTEIEARWLGSRARDLGMSEARAHYAETKVMSGLKDDLVVRRGSAAGDTAEVFDLSHVLRGHSGEVGAIAFHPGGRYLASGASDHTVRAWDARAGRPAGAMSGHTGGVSCVAFSHDGLLLASGGLDNTVRLWKLPNGEPFHTLGHDDWVFSVAFSPDSKLLASGGADKEIKIWSLRTGQPVRTLLGHSHWVQSVLFTSGGRSLISGGADGTVRVWDLSTGETSRTLEHPSWVRSVAVDPDGRLVASGGEDGAIRVWDLEAGRLVYSLAGHAGPALSVVISHDGRLLISGGVDRKIKVWNLGTGEPLLVLSGHQGAVGSVAISHDGRLLAGGGYDRAIRLWREAPFPMEERPTPPPPRASGPTPGRPPNLPD